MSFVFTVTCKDFLRERLKKIITNHHLIGTWYPRLMTLAGVEYTPEQLDDYIMSTIGEVRSYDPFVKALSGWQIPYPQEDLFAAFFEDEEVGKREWKKIEEARYKDGKTILN